MISHAPSVRRMMCRLLQSSDTRMPGNSRCSNHLTDAEVLEEDKLFATLDPTTRMLELDGHQQVLLDGHRRIYPQTSASSDRSFQRVPLRKQSTNSGLPRSDLIQTDDTGLYIIYEN